MCFIAFCSCSIYPNPSGLLPCNCGNYDYSSASGSTLSHVYNSTTVTSYWAPWRLQLPTSRLFTQPCVQAQIKENIKASRHWPLWGEFTGDWWILPQRASNAEVVSLEWHHNGIIRISRNRWYYCTISWLSLLEHLLSWHEYFAWRGLILPWKNISKIRYNIQMILTENNHCPTKQNHDDVMKWKHFPRYWPFAQGIHLSPVNSPHKVQWRGALMFSLIRAWLSGLVYTREAGDLRRHRTHYDVSAMTNWTRSCVFVL